MKRIVKWIATFSIVALVLNVLMPINCDVQAASKITLKNGASAPSTIYTGHSYSLMVKKTSVKFYSSDKSVATVGTTNGKLKPKAPGTVTITAKSKKTGKVVATKKFTVKQRAKKITANTKILYLGLKQSKTIKTSLVPVTSTDVIRFYSSDKSIATVGEKSGKVTAVSEGTTTIKVYAKATKTTANSNKNNKITTVTVVVGPIMDQAIQTATKEVKLCFKNDISSYDVQASDFTVTNNDTGKKIKVSSVTVKKNEVVLHFSIEIKDGKTYTVSYGNTSAKFRATDCKVASLTITPQEIPMKTSVPIYVELKDANGMTLEKYAYGASNLPENLEFEIVANGGYTDSNGLTLLKESSSATATAVLHTSNDENGSKTGTISSGKVVIIALTKPDKEEEKAEEGNKPSTVPVTPSTKPSVTPSTKPSVTPSTKPSTTPSTEPSIIPSTEPSIIPSTDPIEGFTLSLDKDTFTVYNGANLNSDSCAINLKVMDKDKKEISTSDNDFVITCLSTDPASIADKLDVSKMCTVKNGKIQVSDGQTIGTYHCKVTYKKKLSKEFTVVVKNSFYFDCICSENSMDVSLPESKDTVQNFVDNLQQYDIDVKYAAMNKKAGSVVEYIDSASNTYQTLDVDSNYQVAVMNTKILDHERNDITESYYSDGKIHTIYKDSSDYIHQMPAGTYYIESEIKYKLGEEEQTINRECTFTVTENKELITCERNDYLPGTAKAPHDPDDDELSPDPISHIVEEPSSEKCTPLDVIKSSYDLYMNGTIIPSSDYTIDSDHSSAYEEEQYGLNEYHCTALMYEVKLFDTQYKVKCDFSNIVKDKIVHDANYANSFVANPQNKTLEYCQDPIQEMNLELEAKNENSDAIGINFNQIKLTCISAPENDRTNYQQADFNVMEYFGIVPSFENNMETLHFANNLNFVPGDYTFRLSYMGHDQDVVFHVLPRALDSKVDFLTDVKIQENHFDVGEGSEKPFIVPVDEVDADIANQLDEYKANSEFNMMICTTVKSKNDEKQSVIDDPENVNSDANRTIEGYVHKVNYDMNSDEYYIEDENGNDVYFYKHYSYEGMRIRIMHYADQFDKKIDQTNGHPGVIAMPNGTYTLHTIIHSTNLEQGNECKTEITKKFTVKGVPVTEVEQLPITQAVSGSSIHELLYNNVSASIDGKEYKAGKNSELRFSVEKNNVSYENGLYTIKDVIVYLPYYEKGETKPAIYIGHWMKELKFKSTEKFDFSVDFDEYDNFKQSSN